MKKLLLIITLLCVSTAASAEWTQVEESDDKGGFIVYADLKSVFKAKNQARMWSLIDYKREQEETGVHFLSKKVRRKYDCQARHVKTLAFKLFSWNMGRGELVRSYNQPQEWKKIEPDSAIEAEWEAACNPPVPEE